MILDNLRRPASRTRVKGERLVFDALEPLRRALDPGGRRVHRRRRQDRRVAVAIGPSTAPSDRSRSRRPPRRRSRASASTCWSSAASPSIRTSSEEADSATGKLTVLPRG